MKVLRLRCLLPPRSAGAKNCQLVRTEEVAVTATVGCWALGGRGCSQGKGSCLWTQAEELNSVTVKHLFQRGTDMASLQCSGEKSPPPISLPSLAFPQMRFRASMNLPISNTALTLCCQRSGFSQASYIFPCSEIWSGKNLRITFSPFVQGSRTSGEGSHRLPPRCHHSSRTGQGVHRRTEFTACAQTVCPRKAGAYPGEIFLSGKHHSRKLVNNTHEI